LLLEAVDHIAVASKPLAAVQHIEQRPVFPLVDHRPAWEWRAAHRLAAKQRRLGGIFRRGRQHMPHPGQCANARTGRLHEFPPINCVFHGSSLSQK
jgi:hypothetical protein